MHRRTPFAHPWRSCAVFYLQMFLPVHSLNDRQARSVIGTNYFLLSGSVFPARRTFLCFLRKVVFQFVRPMEQLAWPILYNNNGWCSSGTLLTQKLPASFAMPDASRQHTYVHRYTVFRWNEKDAPFSRRLIALSPNNGRSQFVARRPLWRPDLLLWLQGQHILEPMFLNLDKSLARAHIKF